MKLLVKIVKDFQLLTIFAKSSILDIWQDSEYASIQWIIKTNELNKVKANQDTSYIRVLEALKKPCNKPYNGTKWLIRKVNSSNLSNIFFTYPTHVNLLHLINIFFLRSVLFWQSFFLNFNQRSHFCVSTNLLLSFIWIFLKKKKRAVRSLVWIIQ